MDDFSESNAGRTCFATVAGLSLLGIQYGLCFPAGAGGTVLLTASATAIMWYFAPLIVYLAKEWLLFDIIELILEVIFFF